MGTRWLTADRPRSEAGQMVSAFVGATVMGLTYAVVVGEQRGSVTYGPSTYLQAASPPLETVLAPIFWWSVGMALGGLGWIVLVERRLPDRPHLQGRHRAIPGAIAAGVTSFGIQIFARMLPPYHAGYTEDGYTWSMSPLWMVILLSMFACLGSGIYVVGRLIMGDPDDEPAPVSAPDPTWEARRSAAADAMRGRTWEDPS